jgi:hypothetical protein
MVGIFGGCCARAVSGQVVAAPPRSVMNSRRLMLDPKLSRRIIATKPTTLIGAEPASRTSLLVAADVRIEVINRHERVALKCPLGEPGEALARCRSSAKKPTIQYWIPWFWYLGVSVRIRKSRQARGDAV